MFDEGLPYTEMARALGVSKNSAISMGSRLGFPQRQKGSPRCDRTRALAVEAKRHQARFALPALSRVVAPPVERLFRPVTIRPAPAALPPPPPVPLPEDCRPCTIVELTDHRCHWPEGDPLTPEFRYCGALKPLEGPYCPHHTKIAYTPRRTGGPKPGAGTKSLLRSN